MHRLAPLVLAAACAGSRVAAPPTHERVEDALLADPAYRAVEDDPALAGAFQRYWAWMGGLDIPDVAYLDGLPHDDLERLVMLHHEEVELDQWLVAGHQLEDIVSIEYYQAHYPEVYPTAHAEAMRAELAALEAFAVRVGVGRVPERALVLVGPMVERRGVSPAMADRRLKFNPEIAAQTPAREELEAAARVYEAGGYAYRDRDAVIDAAVEAVAGASP